MIRTRVIPCLLLEDGALVKTLGFGKRNYIGDPLNAVRIFNEFEVDELAFLDITATNEDRRPSYELLSEVASECFMPLMYGGGIRSLDEARKILNLGFEKVSLNSSALENPDLITQIAAQFGSQSIVVSIDAKKGFLGGYRVMSHGGKRKWDWAPEDWAKKASSLGAGEILINSIDQDGRMEGYDLDLIKRISQAVDIPVIATGGAGELKHLTEAVEIGGASALGVGSMVVFQGKNRAVLINFPNQFELEKFLPSVESPE